MATPHSTRRDFLKGRPAGGSGDTKESAHGLPDPTADPYLVRIGRRAMACEFQIYLNAGQYPAANELALAALDRVDQLESRLSVYRDDSEVSVINRTAAEGPVQVEPGLFDLLQQSLELYRQTDGAFDVTAGPLSEVWGFSRRQGRIPTDEELAAALDRVGSDFLKLDAEASTIEFTKRGVTINLGGNGKGYALDRAAELLVDAGVGDFLFHGGNSSVLTRGGRAAAGESTHWSVGVLHPLRPGVRLAEVVLRDRALSTSGSQTQSFHFQGDRYGHILDPCTGRPAEGMLSATVLADTAAEADALSTALYVLGMDRAIEFCQTRPDIAAILVAPTGPADIRVETCNLDPSLTR